MNAQEHLQDWLRLLQLEQRAEEDFYRQQVLETPLQVRKAQGICWYPVVVRQIEVGFGQKLVLELERTSQLGQPHTFQNGQILALFSQSQPGEAPLTGVASDVRLNQLRLVLSHDELPDWLEDGKLGLDVCYDETTFREMRRAVERFQHTGLPAVIRQRELLLGSESPRFLPGPTRSDPALNAAQNRAVQQVLAAEDLALIHGPPGTGKTTTLIAAIRAVLQSESQVLVSAPSNTATDLLCEKLAAAGVRVVRLGHPARVSPQVWPLTLEAQISQHPQFAVLQGLRREARDLRTRALRFKRNFGPAERARRSEEIQESRRMLAQARELEQRLTTHLLDQAQAILCTLVGASMELLWKRQFQTVFIDEAAQALLGGSLIPIQRARRVVLAGDHCQLPPTVKSPAAQAGGFNRTLFEVCMAHHPEAATLLDTQYRMHAQIMGFSNQLFYQGRLQADSSVAGHTLPPAEAEPWLARPLEFIDTAGCSHDEELNPESRSLRNPGEAQLLKTHLAAVLEHLPEAQRFSLGIIAPYREQVNLLSEQLAGSSLCKAFASCSIDTVDGFQGQERDLLYISLVRSNQSGEIGFLADTRRMNVALTRARKKLVVLGDSATLAHHPFYREFISYCESLNACRSGWEFGEFF
jgi:ATP-dependent RNA/DNA helicase IGHMBP2